MSTFVWIRGKLKRFLSHKEDYAKKEIVLEDRNKSFALRIQQLKHKYDITMR